MAAFQGGLHSNLLIICWDVCEATFYGTCAAPSVWYAEKCLLMGPYFQRRSLNDKNVTGMKEGKRNET